jgi:hypothetical protein
MRLGYILIFLSMAIFSLSGCSGNQVAVTVGLGETFTINVGKSAQITGEEMVITFDEVIGDSRCPQTVNCVWAGVASSRVTIVHQGTTYSLALNQPGLTEQAQDSFINYTLKYSLNPYPKAGEEISPRAYRLTATVTK